MTDASGQGTRYGRATVHHGSREPPATDRSRNGRGLYRVPGLLRVAGDFFKRERNLAYLLVAPSVLAILVVAIYPVVYAVWLSLHERIPHLRVSEFIWLDNYLTLFGSGRFWGALWNTTYFAFVSVGLELVLGMGIALLLHRSFKGRGWVRAAVLVPWAIPTVVSAKMWGWIYNANFGVLNYALRRLGLVSGEVNWLGSTFWAIHAAIVADVWKATPFAALLLLAGLQTIPEELYEAAEVDGAGRWKRFRYVTLPLLKPVILVTLLLRTLDAFRVFDVIYVLTDGGPANSTETLSIYAYKTLFTEMRFGYGSTISVVTFACVMAVSVFYIRLLSRRGEE